MNAKILLMSHPGQVLETSVIIDRVWAYAGRGDGTLLKNVIYRLRRKLEPDPHDPRYILTVIGSGYTFQPDYVALFKSCAPLSNIPPR